MLELKKDADPELVMAYLFKHTPLQTNFNVNLTCLVPDRRTREVGAPAARSTSQAMLEHFLDFRLEVVDAAASSTSSTSSSERIHILEGFAKIFDALDEMIRSSASRDGKADAARSS